MLTLLALIETAKLLGLLSCDSHTTKGSHGGLALIIKPWLMDLFTPTRARHHTNFHPNHLGRLEKGLPKQLDRLIQCLRR